MTARALLRILGLLALLACFLPGAASAAPGKVPPGTPLGWAFHVDLKGSQATTWHYLEQTPGPCGVAEAEGDGSQMLTFASEPGHAIAIGPDGSGGISAGTGIYVSPVTAGRDNEVRTNTPTTIGRQCGGPTLIQNMDLPGCGSIEGSLRLRMEFDDAGRRVTFSGTDPAFAGGNLDATLPGCPAFLDQGAIEGAGETLAAEAKIPVSRLLSSKPRTIVINASTVRPFDVGSVSGRTVTTYRLTLRRYARVVKGF